MKNLHSIRYYEKRLAKLEHVSDSINYPIDDNADYIRATALLPLTVNEGGERGAMIPAAFFPALRRGLRSRGNGKKGGGEGMNRWKSAARYVEITEGWIIDTGAGYIAIRKADGKSAEFSPWMGVYDEILEWLKMRWLKINGV